MDPSVDALQQFGSALSIQDVNVFFYTSFKKTQACIRLCIKRKMHLICKWCLIFIGQVVLLIGDTWWRSSSTVASKPEGCSSIPSLSVFMRVCAPGYDHELADLCL